MRRETQGEQEDIQKSHSAGPEGPPWNIPRAVRFALFTQS